MERIKFKIKFSIEDLEQLGLAETTESQREHRAQLIFKISHSPILELRIFFEEKSQFSEKIGWWAQRNGYDKLLTIMTITEVEQSNGLKDIDFRSSKVVGISQSFSFSEKGSNDFIIKLNYVRLVYAHTTYEEEAIESDFYLNETSRYFIEEKYFFDSFSPFDEESKKRWVAQNRMKDHFPFGKMSYLTDFNFYTKKSVNDSEVIIVKEPRLRLKHGIEDERQILNHADAICSLLSFMVSEKIDYVFARVFTKDERIIIIRLASTTIKKSPSGLFSFDFKNDGNNLIGKTDSNIVLNHLDFITILIDKFNLALKTTGETRFMLLYNNLEQIRNHFIKIGQIETESNGQPNNPRKVKDEFSFSISKDKTDKFIRDKLKELSEIICETDKNDFLNELSGKVGFIKLRTMTNQFKSLFEFCELHPENYQLNFSKLKSIRDSVFHGHKIDDDKDLEHINKKLPRFVGMFMLKLMGVSLQGRQ